MDEMVCSPCGFRAPKKRSFYTNLPRTRAWAHERDKYAGFGEGPLSPRLLMRIANLV